MNILYGKVQIFRNCTNRMNCSQKCKPSISLAAAAAFLYSVTQYFSFSCPYLVRLISTVQLFLVLNIMIFDNICGEGILRYGREENFACFFFFPNEGQSLL